MPPAKRPWFRVYTELFADRKVRRLTPAHRWLWLAVLACARTSPQPGALLVADGVPCSVGDIADVAALPKRTVTNGLAALEGEGLIERRGEGQTWFVPKWMDRQFESDVTAERVAKHRYNVGGSNADKPPDVTPFSRARTTESESDLKTPQPPTSGGRRSDGTNPRAQRRNPRSQRPAPARPALPTVDELDLEPSEIDAEAYANGVAKARQALTNTAPNSNLNEHWNSEEEPF
jgi:DNA-binding transcriptional ArsR family regulator